MSATVSTDLLMRLCRATPEQLAAIERFLTGGNAETLKAEMLKSEGESGRERYVLQKGLGGWRLVFNGRESVLPDEKGVAYVAALLMDPPAEPVHAAELANRVLGDAVVEAQRNLGVEDAETTKAMGEARRKCLAVMEDEGISFVAFLEDSEKWVRKPMNRAYTMEQECQYTTLRLRGHA